MDSSGTESVFPLIPQVLSGATADVYFIRALEIMGALHMNPTVGVEVFAGRDGVCCGVTQVAQLLRAAGFSGRLSGLSEGEPIVAGEAVLQISGPYASFGLYETALLGMLASSSGWCTAAREVADAAEDIPVVSFGARHVHPNVAGIMDYAAVVGGCVTCSTTLGAALAGTSASGTMPHALVLVVGDTVVAAEAFDRIVDPDVPRVILVDTFQDEVVESLRVAEALGDVLQGIRLDTPRERGGVTPQLVTELRARLDGAGYPHVHIVVSGGVTPERIRAFRAAGAPVNSYGVGSFISGAQPIDFTADIREIEGKPVAKRGRIPGLRPAPRLHRLP